MKYNNCKIEKIDNKDYIILSNNKDLNNLVSDSIEELKAVINLRLKVNRENKKYRKTQNIKENFIKKIEKENKINVINFMNYYFKNNKIKSKADFLRFYKLKAYLLKNIKNGFNGVDYWYIKYNFEQLQVMIEKGYIPVYDAEVKNYYLRKNNSGFKINKTDFLFCTYLKENDIKTKTINGIINLKNIKKEIINLDKLSTKKLIKHLEQIKNL